MPALERSTLTQCDAESLHHRLEFEEQIAETLQTELHECAEYVDHDLRCRNEQLAEEEKGLETQIKKQRADRIHHRVCGSTKSTRSEDSPLSGKASVGSVVAAIRRLSLTKQAHHRQHHKRLSACDFVEYATQFERELLEWERENDALKMRLSLCNTDIDELQEAGSEERQMIVEMEELTAAKQAKKLALQEELQSIDFEYRCLGGEDCALEGNMEAQQQRRETNLKRVEDMMESRQAAALEQVNRLKRQNAEMEWHSSVLQAEIGRLQGKCQDYHLRRLNLIRDNSKDFTSETGKIRVDKQMLSPLSDNGSEKDACPRQPRWVSVLCDELDALHDQLTIARELFVEAEQDEREFALDMLTPRSEDSHLSDHQLLQRLLDTAARYGGSSSKTTSDILELECDLSLQHQEAALLQDMLEQSQHAEFMQLQGSQGESQALQTQLQEHHGEARQLCAQLERSEPFVKEAELLRRRLAGAEARQMQSLEDDGQIDTFHNLLARARSGESELRATNEEQQNLLRTLQASHEHLHLERCDASKAEAMARREHTELRQTLMSLEADADFMNEKRGVAKQHQDTIVKDLERNARRLKQQLADVEAHVATQRVKKHNAQQDALNLRAVAQQLSSQLAEACNLHMQERQQLVHAVSELRTVAHQRYNEAALLQQQMVEPKQSTKREKRLMRMVAELQDESSHLHRQLEKCRLLDKQQQSRNKANERHIQRLCALVDELDGEVGRSSTWTGGHKSPGKADGLNSDDVDDAELLRMLRTVRLVDGDLEQDARV